MYQGSDNTQGYWVTALNTLVDQWVPIKQRCSNNEGTARRDIKDLHTYVMVSDRFEEKGCAIDVSVEKFSIEIHQI